MMLKMHPTTIRLTEEDQTFLATLEVSGASTISDKIRTLIESRRLQQQAGCDYRSALMLASNLIDPLQNSVKVAENKQGVHSQFVRRVLEWTPELLATIMAEGPTDCDQPVNEAILRRLEDALVAQVVRLMDVTLQTYVARDTALYTPGVLSSERLKPINRLCRLAEDDDKNNPL